jgi:hypothetical protein
MEEKYLYDSFNSKSRLFDKNFTDYLNKKRSDQWKVKDCSFCHDTENEKMWASCIFERSY